MREIQQQSPRFKQVDYLGDDGELKPEYEINNPLEQSFSVSEAESILEAEMRQEIMKQLQSAESQETKLFVESILAGFLYFALLVSGVHDDMYSSGALTGEQISVLLTVIPFFIGFIIVRDHNEVKNTMKDLKDQLANPIVIEERDADIEEAILRLLQSGSLATEASEEITDFSQ